MRPKYILSILASLLVVVACQDKKKEEAVSAIKEWMGKEILFPKKSVFTIRGTDTIDFALNASDYKIVSYIDTAGCISCQLKLAEWQHFMDEVDTDKPGHFSKSLKVYGNMIGSPLKLIVKGETH